MSITAAQAIEFIQDVNLEVNELRNEVIKLKAEVAKLKDAPIAKPDWEVKADIVIAIADALDALKIPYVFGGETIKGMDCSGFVQFIYGQVGVSMPRVSDNQSDVGTDVAYEDIRRGDLIFYDFNHDGKVTHVAICRGDGKMIHTNTPDTGINIQPTTWNRSSIVKIKRVLK